MLLSPHIKSVFHINWLVFGVIDKTRSEKGPNGEGEKKTLSVNEPCSVVVLLEFMFAHLHFYFDTLVNNEGEALQGDRGELKAVSSLRKR